MFVVVAIAAAAAATAADATTTTADLTDPGWKVVNGMDNQHNLDSRIRYGMNVSALKKQCEADKWCAGFSAFYGQLKYSAADLRHQANTQFYVRIPAPPVPEEIPVFLWPRPFKYTVGTTELMLRGPIRFNATGISSSLLVDTLARYAKILEGPEQPPSVGIMNGCDVHVETSDETLTAKTDESYDLMVPNGPRCTITATTVYGAMHGLETFAALWNTANRTFPAAPLVVQDKPRYKYRGIMQDTARHFLPVQVLLDHLEAMSMAKVSGSKCTASAHSVVDPYIALLSPLCALGSHLQALCVPLALDRRPIMAA
jgi:hypothetical protein